MSNSLLSLPEGSIESLTEHQLSDLLDYTDPGWVLVDDEVSPRRRRWLTRRVDSPLLFMAEPGWKVEDDRVFLILNSAEDIPEETGDEQDLCVVSNFIEEDVDPHSFSVNWTGLEPYRQLTESLPEGTSHLAVNHPTDRTITPGNSTLTLHGAGAPPDRTRFPLLNVGGSVYTEETLSHAKLGLQAIKGIGRSKARTLRESGFETRQTLQQQSPESLLSLDGIWPLLRVRGGSGGTGPRNRHAPLVQRQPPIGTGTGLRRH